jgi:predicted metal-dependent enzyme (double-stranded beta helix superfamily)
VTARELERLAAEYAASEQLWIRHLDPSAIGRRYASLRRDDELDVWAIFWRPGNDTGWHDHDTSAGAVRVVRGELEEHVLGLRGDRSRRVGPGRSWSFGPDHIHRVTCPTPQAVSIHVYSPPLWRMGQYTETAGGLLRRRSVSYAEELRPASEPGCGVVGAAASP